MSKSLKSRKSKSKIENGKILEVVDVNDYLGNLLYEAERLKSSLHQQKLKSPTLSLTASVIGCVNIVLSEYGEESIKRQRFKNDVTECRPKEECNNKWTSCVKVLEELITSDRVLDEELSSLILLLIAQVHERQSLRVTNSSVLHEVIGSMVAHIHLVDRALMQPYMRCLASFILGNLVDIPKELFASLSGAFFRASERQLEMTNPNSDSLETLKYCISGLTNLCYLSPSSDGSEIDDFLAKRFQTCGRFFHLFVLCLEQLPLFVGITQISLFRMQHQCLHGLNYVSQRPHGLSLDNTERLLAVLRVYCAFGMFHVKGETSGAFTTDKDEHCSTRGESGENDCLGHNRLFSRGESGDQDYIDETVTAYRPMRKWEVKTRRLAFELLLKVLAKSWRKVSTVVWEMFMPSTAWSSHRRFNLLNMLERERDCCLKVLILKAIQQCVTNCKDLLASAQHQTATSTFVSRSQNLASVIDEVHERLLSTLAAEKTIEIRVETLQCLLALIRSVPYHRLRPNMVHGVVHGLRQVLLDSLPTQTLLRCVVLDCFTSLVTFESVSTEMRHLLLRPTMQSLFFGDGDSDKCGHPSWLVQLCVRLAHPSVVAQLWTGPLSSESWGAHMDPVVAKVIEEGANETDGSVRCQALMTVGAMLSQHGSLIRPSLDTLKRTLLACLHESLQEKSSNSALRSHVLRVFSGFLGTLDNKKSKRYLGIVQESQNIANDFTESQTSCFLSSDSNDKLSIDWWSSFLDTVVLCLQDSDDSVRASAAQCMSLMSESVLEQLIGPEDRRKYYLLLMPMFKDPSVAVCCQAIWALGYWVAMRPLNIDLQFVDKLVCACYDIAVVAIEDPSVYVVCANATWSLSNAVEVLVAHKEALLSCCKLDLDNRPCHQLVSHYLSDVTCVYKLLSLFCDLCSLKKAGQVAASARIHENAIRGLGYLCRFVDENLVVQESISAQLLIASDIFCKAIQLPDKAGRVKVKWNACLSASHVCRNRTLIADVATFRLQTLVDTLIGTVASDRYFKVRNNSLISILTLLDTGGRSSLGGDLLPRLVRPLAEACVSVAHKSTVPFSEVHRHCLCLYLLKFLLLKIVVVMHRDDLVALSVDADLLALLSVAFTEHVAHIWQQLHHLNRSFNKHTLLTNTLMIRMAVSATATEVDDLLASLRDNLDRRWLSIDAVAATTLFTDLYDCVMRARSCEQTLDEERGLANLSDSNFSDDDGLLTKRPGASLLFSQIYD